MKTLAQQTKIVAEEPRLPLETPWLWVGAALLAQTGWGIYPVLGRYMQTVSGLPGLSILVVGGMPMVTVMLLYVLPRYGRQIIRARILWMLALVVVIRSVTNILAMRYTLAVYVQLITLMTPFIVVALSLLLLHEKPPPYTGRAVTFSFVGAFLMMASGISASGIHFDLSTGDWIGIALAFTSSVALAGYMLVIRGTTKTDLPGPIVWIFQMTMIAAFSLLLSLLMGEDWSQWAYIGASDWLVVMAYILLVAIGANGLQIAALRHLGAPFVSSLMAWRLVSALIFAGLLLGERLTSPVQFLGALIVLLTITWYLWKQQHVENKS